MEPLTPARLAVVLVNWRGADDTIECLETLLRCPTPMKVIVCDNASGDGSVEKMQAWARGDLPAQAKSPAMAHLGTPPIAKPIAITTVSRAQASQMRLSGAGLTIVETGGNLGFAGGNNIGLQLALADPDIDYIWFLNNDTVVQPQAPAAIIRAFEKDDEIGILGGVIRFYYRPDRLQLLNGYRFSPWTGRGYPIAGGHNADDAIDTANVRAQTDFICGAALAITRRFAETIGEMDERYFLYFEEIDWAVRGRRLFKMGFAADAVIYHKEGGSIGSSRETAKRSALSEYYLARSKILFGRKHAAAKLPVLLAHNFLLALRRVTQGHLDKAGAIVKGSLNLPFRQG